MKRIKFDWTITAGTVLQLFIYTVLFITFLVRHEYQLNQLKEAQVDIKRAQVDQGAMLAELSMGQSDLRSELKVMDTKLQERTFKKPQPQKP